MTINFADLNPGNNTTAIKIGGGVFEVTYDGTLKATSATIEGQIFAQSGKIGCTSRNSNDGWTIEKNKLYSGSGATRVELNSDKDEEFAIWAGATSSTSAKDSYFAVSKKGSLYAKEGNIGGWTLKSRSLSSNNNKIGMASSGSYVFWSGANTGNPVILQILAIVVPTSMLLMAENSLVRTQKCVVTLQQIDLNVIMVRSADGLLVVVLYEAEALIYILVVESFVMTSIVMVVISVDGQLEKIQFLLVALFYKVMVTFILGQVELVWSKEKIAKVLLITLECRQLAVMEVLSFKRHMAMVTQLYVPRIILS